MQKLGEYRDNAQACRKLARHMPAAHRAQLLQMAEAWERIAEERQAAIDVAADPGTDSDDREA